MNNRNKKAGPPAALLLKKTGSATGSSTTNGKKEEGFLQKNSKTILQVVISIVVVLFAIAMWNSSSSPIKNLINADDGKMKEALLGDLPHLFYCHRGRQDEAVPTIFSDLSKIKSSSQLGFALVNCSQVMPSGKNLWDRFKLKKDWQPTLFETAPWAKPKQVPPLSLKDAMSLKKFVDGTMGPRGYEVLSDKELLRHCGFDKTVNKTAPSDNGSGRPDTCFVLMKGTRYAKTHADLEERLVRKYPKIKIATINANKKRLSIEDTQALTPDMFALKVHALRNATHYLSMVNPTTWDYVTTFMSQAISSPTYSYSGDYREPIKLVKSGTSPFKSRTGGSPTDSSSGSGPSTGPSTRKGSKPVSSSESSKTSKEKAKTTATEPASPTETAEERQAREQRRRDEMERQAREHLFEDVDGSDSDNDGGGGGEEEEEEDDSVIEL